VAWLPVSPNFSLSSTTMARFSGCWVATVASEPRLISMSPSPVITRHAFCRAAPKASPQPHADRRAHGAPQRHVERTVARFGDVPVGRAQPGDHQQIIVGALEDLFSPAVFSGAAALPCSSSLLPEIFDAYELLAQQHRHRLAAVEGRARRGRRPVAFTSSALSTE